MPQTSLERTPVSAITVALVLSLFSFPARADGNYYEFQYRNSRGFTSGYYQFLGYSTDTNTLLFDVYAEVG